MNKFTKVILILAVSLLGIGIVCTAAAFVMGASLNSIRNVTVYLNDMNKLGIHHIQGENFSIDIEDSDDVWPDIDIDFLDDSKETEAGSALSQMSSFENIRNINIETGAASMSISYADIEKVEVLYDDAVGMNMELDDEELDIECRASGNVEILIPAETQLQEIDLDIGAGQVSIQDIFFQKIDADIGAGQLIIQAPDAQSEYNYSVDCALGEVSIGDETFSGISSTSKNNNGTRYIDIDCGAGRVEIQFAE